MNAPREDDDLASEVSRKAERLTRARRAPPAMWRTLTRVVGLGWVFILPLVLGAAGGRLLARWTGRPSIALIGLGVGLAAGVYGVFRQVKEGLEDDEAPPQEQERRKP